MKELFVLVLMLCAYGMKLMFGNAVTGFELFVLAVFFLACVLALAQVIHRRNIARARRRRCICTQADAHFLLEIADCGTLNEEQKRRLQERIIDGTSDLSFVS